MTAGGAARVEEEPSDRVREVADAPVTFESDEWKRFAFPMSGNEQKKKATLPD